MTDQQLLQAYRAGELKDLGEVVARHLSLIYGTAKRLAGDRDAADITLAVLSYLAQTQARSNQRASLANWCFETTYQCCKLRKSTTAHGISAAEMAMDQPQLRFPDDILMMLRPPEREVLLLHCLENQTLEEAADALGIPVDRASARAKRGFAQMQMLLESHGRAADQMMMTRILTAISQEKSVPPMPPTIPQALSPMARDLVVALAARKPIGRMIAASAFIVIIGVMLIVAVIMSAAFFSPAKNGNPTPAPKLAADQPVENPVIEPAPPPVKVNPQSVDPRSLAESPGTLDSLPGSRLCLGSYVVLLSDRLAAALSDMSTREQTTSQGFDVYRLPASKMHQMLRDLPGDMIAASRDVAVARPTEMLPMRLPGMLMLPGLNIAREEARNSRLNVERLNGIFSTSGPASSLSLNSDGRIIVNIDQRLTGGQLVCRDRRPPGVRLSGQIQLQTPMGPDEALLCLSEPIPTSSIDPAATVVLAVVIETFSLTPVESHFITSRPKCSRWDWPLYGADYARWMAAQSVIWENQARTHFVEGQQGSPHWTQKLPDGQTSVRLVALSRTDVGHACWWTPDGQPLAGIPELFNLTSRAPKLRVLVEASRPSTEDPWITEERRKNAGSGNSTRDDEFSRFDSTALWHESMTLVDIDTSKIIFNVGYGEGTYKGRLDPTYSGSQQVGFVFVTFQQQTISGNVHLTATATGLEDTDDPYFVLKLKDGRLLPLLYQPRLVVDRGIKNPTQVPLRGNVSLATWQQVEQVEFWVRPMAHVTFDHLTTVPTEPLPLDFNRADAIAAELKFRFATRSTGAPR